MNAKQTLLLLAVAFFAAVPSGCNRSSNAPSAAAAKQAEGVRAEPRDLNLEIQVPATIEGDLQADLMAMIDSYVISVDANIGDIVEEGTVLAHLEMPEIEAEVIRRREMLAEAEAVVRSRRAQLVSTHAELGEQDALLLLRQSELDRIKSLVQGGALSQDRLKEAEYAFSAVEQAILSVKANIEAAATHIEAAEAAVKVALAEVSKAETMEGYLAISAPFHGVVVDRLVDPGALVRPSGSNAGPLFRIVSYDKLRAVIYLPYDEAVKMDNNDPVTLHNIQGRGDLVIDELQIDRHAMAYQPGSRMMRAEIDIANKPDAETGRRQLAPGDYGMVKLSLLSYPAQLSVPKSAIGDIDKNPYVVVVDENNQCSRVSVKVIVIDVDVDVDGDGEIDGDYVGISGEIEEGVRIIAEKPGSYSEGQEVTLELR